MRATLRLASVLSLLALTPLARAQSRAQGFALDRFEPSERGRDWFAADSLDLRGRAKPALGVIMAWSHNPLVTYDAATGDRVGAVVANQWIAHAFGSLTLMDRLRISADLPVIAYQDGTASTVRGQLVSAQAASAVGDLRLGATLGIVGDYGTPFSLAAGVQLELPTGQRASFSSDGSASVVPRVLAAGEFGWFVYSAEADLQLGESRKNSLNDTSGVALRFVGAAGVRPVRALTVGPELFGSTVLGNSRAFARTATPAELLFGGHYDFGDVSVGLGAGWGLTRGYGSPELRVLGGLEWSPRPYAAVPKPLPPRDSDGDGIIDEQDACVNEQGRATDDPKTNGCPEPVLDRDRDGVLDAVDACPDEAGLASEDAQRNGCPPPKDRDGDGILDPIDACADEAGVASEDPKSNGCPPRDRDGDGVLDRDDACPDAPGPKSELPATSGCPLAHIDSTQIVILEPVRFAYNSDRILPESEPVLRAVAEVVLTHAEIDSLEVHGHTDDKGNDAYNMVLSKRRAAAVAKWLAGHGIDKRRIVSHGFGETRPLVPNDTDENRTRNRRVEFHIVPKGMTAVTQP